MIFQHHTLCTMHSAFFIASRPQAGPQTSKPEGRSSNGSAPRRVPMPAIASLEDLKAAQKDLLEAKDLNELKAVFKKWRRIGWKNVCKLWLE